LFLFFSCLISRLFVEVHPPLQVHNIIQASTQFRESTIALSMFLLTTYSSIGYKCRSILSHRIFLGNRLPKNFFLVACWRMILRGNMIMTKNIILKLYCVVVYNLEAKRNCIYTGSWFPISFLAFCLLDTGAF
jgi:hypothetical protein